MAVTLGTCKLLWLFKFSIRPYIFVRFSKNDKNVNFSNAHKALNIKSLDLPLTFTLLGLHVKEKIDV